MYKELAPAFAPYLCVSFECGDFVSPAEAEADETLQGGLMWQGAGKFSGNLLEVLFRNKSQSQYDRFTQTMYFADTSISEIRFHHVVMVEKWNRTRHAKKMVEIWERSCSICFIPTMPKNQPDGKPVAAQQNGLLKKVLPCQFCGKHMLMCCFARLWACIKRNM